MVLGRKGLQVEAWKFGVYLMIPITASAAFNYPEMQQYWADYFQFLKYPANPNTNMKEQFEDLQKKREEEKEQRRAYQEQIRMLQESAQQSRRRQEEANTESSQGRRRWFGLF
mmetsp:Transcript_9786/g.13795  ORF Transcript_9786/g.13795 Transcript_9786/m.13795 type:complete len:113 (-) Transcript_9786:240-578(-)